MAISSRAKGVFIGPNLATVAKMTMVTMMASLASTLAAELGRACATSDVVFAVRAFLSFL